MSDITEKLIAMGIDPIIAAAVAKSQQPKVTKEKKRKAYYAGMTSREKVNIPVLVTQTCNTCKSVTTFKQVITVWSDAADTELKASVGLCVNCIRMMDTDLTKDELISLVVVMNHPDAEIRRQSLRHQIKMAKRKTAQEWLIVRDDKTIPLNDEGKKY